MTKYSYIPSYRFKTGSKYKQLTDEYQNLFKEIKEEKIDIKNNKNFFIGVKHISDYIYQGFFYNVKQNYDSKTNLDKIITSMYSRLKSFYGTEESFNEKYSKQIYDIAENSIFYSLGIEKYKKRKSFIWTKKNGYYENFIKHTSEKVFKTLIFLFLKTEISNLEIELENTITENNEELSAIELIKLSDLSEFIPEEIKEKIINYLENEDDKNIKQIQPYLDKIYEVLKEKEVLK